MVDLWVGALLGGGKFNSSWVEFNLGAHSIGRLMVLECSAYQYNGDVLRFAFLAHMMLFVSWCCSIGGWLIPMSTLYSCCISHDSCSYNAFQTREIIVSLMCLKAC